MRELDALVVWVQSILPELVGGFVGYFVHVLHHALFRRPGQALLRRIVGKGAPPL